MEMSHLASKLRAHKLDIFEDLLVHLVLISLPTQFSQFKVSYNCEKKTWSLNELISHCVQEEERLKKGKIESAHLAGTSKDKGKKRKKDKEVEAIGIFRLLLKFGTYLDLNETFFVPSFRRNLISISILDKFGYFCSFGNNKFSIFQNSNLVGTGSLSYLDNLYMLDTIASYHETLQLSTQGVKRKITNKNSSSLWHKRLGHISKRIIERLVSDGILDSLDFADFEICTNCIKGKQTNTRRFGANMATNVLELIHIDICGPFPTVS